MGTTYDNTGPFHEERAKAYKGNTVQYSVTKKV